MEYLIVCPLVFIAGFVDAVAGGGGLISLPAYLLAGFPVHFAIGTNKLSSAMGTSLATWRYAKSGYVPWKESLCCAAVALVASNLGTNLGLLVDDGIFRVILLAVLPLTALYLARHRSFGEEKDPLPKGKALAIALTITFVIGMYDGFYGPGTGTFLILLLTGLAHVSLGKANGMAKVINLTTNLSSLAVFLVNGKVMIPLGLAAGCFSILGNYLGTRFFTKGEAKIARPMIFLVIGIFFLRTVLELLGIL